MIVSGRDSFRQLPPRDREQVLAFQTFLIQLGGLRPTRGLFESEEWSQMHPELQRWALGDQRPIDWVAVHCQDSGD